MVLNFQKKKEPKKERKKKERKKERKKGTRRRDFLPTSSGNMGDSESRKNKSNGGRTIDAFSLVLVLIIDYHTCIFVLLLLE